MPELTPLIALGLIAGLLQFWGYWIYLTIESIDPNPVTWFMFAYGTAILTILEWDSDATFAELILPTVCAALSIWVSVRCWLWARRRDPSRWWPHDWWPEDRLEQYSFLTDIAITVGYLAAWGLATFALVPPEYREWAVLAFLLLSNASTLPSFYPLLRETYLDPSKEHWLPWVIWTLAYLVLGYVTFVTQGTLWHVLMLYPASNALMHGLVAVVSLSTPMATEPVNEKYPADTKPVIR